MYKININMKDIVRLNQEIGEKGQLSNRSSLEYALSVSKHNKSWLYELSHLVRSLLVDHAFTDGNKRTALALIILYLDSKDIAWDEERLIRAMHRIAKKNINSVSAIMREIENAFKH